MSSPAEKPLRIAMISMHTSPLEQAGSGDAGGMNVYIRHTALGLGQAGHRVDIFTRATRPSQGPVVQLAPNVRVINIVAGPYEGLAKEDLPTQMVAFAGGIMEWVTCQQRVDPSAQRYDVIHSHYWLSGQVGWLLRDLWRIPLVHTAHTLALVKNKFLAAGDTPEPESRRICEQQIIDNADALVVNTCAERTNITHLYDGNAERIHIIEPGADVERFTPGSDRATERSRRELGIPLHATVIAFVGRFQRLKGPHVLLRAIAAMLEDTAASGGMDPDRPLRVLMCGGPSGASARPDELENLARELGIAHVVRFLAPRPPEDLVTVYRAADIVAVPSYNESFGLVAIEAQASGTPVVAARVGGLPIAVDDGRTGLLLDSHSPAEWAKALRELASEDERRIAMSEAAVDHARRFSWTRTAQGLIQTYRAVVAEGAHGGCGSARNGEPLVGH